jgi:benzylsuccinate CoA-transferase BbsF subunit
VELDHPLLGKATVEGPRFKLSRTPLEVRRHGPTLGGDNLFVLEKILGYSEEKISALVIAGALE